MTAYDIVCIILSSTLCFFFIMITLDHFREKWRGDK